MLYTKSTYKYHSTCLSDQIHQIGLTKQQLISHSLIHRHNRLYRRFVDKQYIVLFKTGNGRFRDSHFPRQTFPGQDVSRTRPFPDNHFPGQDVSQKDVSRTSACHDSSDYFRYKMFPRQSLSWTDVSQRDVFRTICINNFEYFGMFMYLDMAVCLRHLTESFQPYSVCAV